VQSVNGWVGAPFPLAHKGRLGQLWDVTLAVYHEIPVIAPLVARLIRLLGLGYKAYAMLFRLILFAISMAPAIVRVGHWWWNTTSVLRGIRYGPNPRNFLDIYLPEDQPDCEPYRRPVVIYVTGGAWIIGYKAWSTLLGDYLRKKGIIMVSIDYRNFPQGTVQSMIEDVRSGIEWTFEKIYEFGGDVENVTLVGQSAGAHLTSMMLLREVNQLGETKMTSIVNRLVRYIGVSGPYDIVDLAPKLHKRGLYSSMLRSIMNQDLFGSSPIRIIPSMKTGSIPRLPPVVIMHGTGDQTVPYEQSLKFAQTLKAAGHANVVIELWDGVSHSEPIVEGPIGGDNFLGAVIASLCCPTKTFEIQSRPLLNKHMLKFAKYVMPF
jgi:prenylcysteine alpha-carboxyl methylesterase